MPVPRGKPQDCNGDSTGSAVLTAESAIANLRHSAFETSSVEHPHQAFGGDIPTVSADISTGAILLKNSARRQVMGGCRCA